MTFGEVELPPQDDAKGNVLQLLRAIDEVLRALKANPPKKPPVSGCMARAEEC